MTVPRTAKRHVWSIVLAGGEGERVKPLILQWLGRHLPKQYCAFVGHRSMFQHTVERATTLTSPERTVVVAALHHDNEVSSQLRERPIGKLLLQPTNCDTAAGIFLPLAYLRARDPHAIVVILPSDHFIYPEHPFLETVRQAMVSVEAMPERVVLLGVHPDRGETEYGWIQRGSQLSGSPNHPVHAVSSFLEKPRAAQADAALRGGCLWNTLVVTATVESLWQAGRTCFPDMMPLFERLESAWDTPDERSLLEAAYRTMPVYNFSSDLLERLPDRIAVIELAGVLWSDWGNPERIAETIRRIGKTPAFPLHCLDQSLSPHPVVYTAE
ncbi:MAG TPA: sugar phosphate nucleotidyltransferase [Nitrospiraceae bacterium]|nr:sugar phosphate nucleotidyltransferase [Nitrospiraceae bacterium]